jgi:NitT/TauT family transport system substrate-binding protein
MNPLRMIAAVLTALALSQPVPARAEANELRVAIQDGLAYLPFIIARNNGLVEKHARQAGLGEVKVAWSKFASGAVMNDALLSGSLDIATGGVPPLVILWARTKGNVDVKALSAWVAVPGYLNTRNPAVQSIKDFTAKDRIAVPAVRTSNQAIYLQMAAEKAFGAGNQNRLDALTVTLSHGDASAAMLSSVSEINSHFTIEPYATIQRNAGARTITSSYEILGGPATTSLVWTTSKFYQANPKLSAAFTAALQEGIDTIYRDRKAAADVYLKATNSKETLESVVAMLEDPNMQFSLTPKRVLPQVEFMHRTGLIKVKPDDWKDLFFPTVHAMPGS